MAALQSSLLAYECLIYFDAILLLGVLMAKHLSSQEMQASPQWKNFINMLSFVRRNYCAQSQERMPRCCIVHYNNPKQGFMGLRLTSLLCRTRTSPSVLFIYFHTHPPAFKELVLMLVCCSLQYPVRFPRLSLMWVFKESPENGDSCWLFFMYAPCIHTKHVYRACIINMFIAPNLQNPEGQHK